MSIDGLVSAFGQMVSQYLHLFFDIMKNSLLNQSLQAARSQMQLTLIHYIWWAVFGLRQTFLCTLTKQFCPRFACLLHIIPRRLFCTCMFTGQL